MDNPATSRARRIASDLLSVGAVTLAPEHPFTWASGLKAPIYCDNRLTMAYPAVRRGLTDGFEDILRTEGLVPDVVVGTATAGIPHAAWLADRLEVPMAYVRSKPKAHGRGNQIEGVLHSGDRVVIVEDLVSTGMSSLTVVDAVRGVGAEILALVAIFSYGLPAAETRFADAGIRFIALTTFETLLAEAVTEGALPSQALESLRAWQADPQSWSAAHGG